MLGLPDTVSACLFDLDGVLTNTPATHARAWKQLFDDVLRERGAPPLELPREYDRFIDGKPRHDGARSFLQARGIEAGEELVRTLGDRNGYVVGVNRGGQANALCDRGADIVVCDLAELLEGRA